MIIIWHGQGYLVAVIVFGCSLVVNLIINATRGKEYYDHHKWPFALSLILSAVICWFLGTYLRKRSDRVVIDKQTGKEIAINQSRHTLFFVPMHYWAPLLLMIALILLSIEFLH